MRLLDLRRNASRTDGEPLTEPASQAEQVVGLAPAAIQTPAALPGGNCRRPSCVRPACEKPPPSPRHSSGSTLVVECWFEWPGACTFRASVNQKSSLTAAPPSASN